MLAADAPTTPGVYCILGRADELLYVGKALNLRRRLGDHRRDDTFGNMARDVRWIERADEHAALCLEADLIVALSPPFNAIMAADAFTYIHADRTSGTRMRLRMSVDHGGYGAFPHLGKGKGSWRSKRTNGGWSAFLRLAWVSFEPGARRFRIPARLRGTSPPPDHDAIIGDVRLLHEFLSGRSARLLTIFRDALDDVPAFMRRPLIADLDAAAEFFRIGPRALRTFRHRHRLPAGPVDQPTFTKLTEAELRDAIGPFVLGPDRGDERRDGRLHRGLDAGPRPDALATLERHPTTDHGEEQPCTTC